jgi:hypothetical protein
MLLILQTMDAVPPLHTVRAATIPCEWHARMVPLRGRELSESTTPPGETLRLVDLNPDELFLQNIVRGLTRARAAPIHVWREAEAD